MERLAHRTGISDNYSLGQMFWVTLHRIISGKVEEFFLKDPSLLTKLSSRETSMDIIFSHNSECRNKQEFAQVSVSSSVKFQQRGFYCLNSLSL